MGSSLAIGGDGGGKCKALIRPMHLNLNSMGLVSPLPCAVCTATLKTLMSCISMDQALSSS